MIRKSYHDWNHTSEFILEFPNLSWNHLDASERDSNIHSRMKDVERISVPVRKTLAQISLGSNNPPTEGRFRIFMFLSETYHRLHH